MTAKTRTLWGEAPKREEEWFVFHDESIPNKRWLLIGLLFVQKERVEEVREILAQTREAEGYRGEIHFSKLPGSFDGPYGADARVARRWMKAYQQNLCEYVCFSCLAVDRHSPKYEAKRFARDFHAYNRFTAMALKAGISWHLGQRDLDRLLIRFVSDEKERQSRPDKRWQDNFEEYLQYRAELDAFISQSAGKNYPLVSVDLRPCDSASEDLLQLTDLLLGATQEALVANASRETKQELGRMVLRWCEDLKKSPGNQRYGFHRRLNIWGFPDADGKPYNQLPFALEANPGQLLLFGGNV